jgi:NTP pyrophosphatase (non-canonical NTP hydrolase)
MIKSVAQMVQEFDTAMGGNPPPEVHSDFDNMKIGLVEEEFEEFMRAIYDEGLGGVSVEKEILKELCDLVYVAVGYALYRGWDFDEAFKRVHESNMSKLGDDGKAIRRADGKVIKSLNYYPPKLDDLVER